MYEKLQHELCHVWMLGEKRNKVMFKWRQLSQMLVKWILKCAGEKLGILVQLHITQSSPIPGLSSCSVKVGDMRIRPQQ